VDVQYFDDVMVGEVHTSQSYEVELDEMLEFNRKWDPLPIHLDDAAARAAGHAGIIASGQYTLCVKQVFINQMPWSRAAVGAMQFDELRFHRPVYAGDALTGTMICGSKRVSKSKPDRGICVFDVTITNQHGETVLSYRDTVMMHRKPQA
jgi:acyl dehydratase